MPTSSITTIAAKRGKVLALLAVALGCCRLHPSLKPIPTPARSPAQADSTKPLGLLLPDAKSYSISFANTGDSFMYMARTKDDTPWDKFDTLVLDSTRTDFSEVTGATYSPDGKHTAFAARDGSFWFVVVDGIRQRTYAYVDAPIFSPNSANIAYFVNGSFVVLNGKEGLHHGDWRIRGDKGKIVAEESVSPWEWDYNRPRFTTDSSMIAYILDWRKLVLNGCEACSWHGDDLSMIMNFALATNGEHWAYALREHAFAAVVIRDGKQIGESYEDIKSIRFTADGGLAWVARNGDRMTLLLNGVNVFSSQSLAYWATLAHYGSSMAIAASVRRADGTWYQTVAVNGKPGRTFDRVSTPIFSPDDRAIAYVAGEGDALFLVRRDALTDEEITQEMAGNVDVPDYFFWNQPVPIFSRDGNRQALAFMSDSKWWLFAGGQTSEIPGEPHGLSFNMDGTALSFGCISAGGEILWNVMRLG